MGGSKVFHLFPKRAVVDTPEIPLQKPRGLREHPSLVHLMRPKPRVGRRHLLICRNGRGFGALVPARSPGPHSWLRKSNCSETGIGRSKRILFKGSGTSFNLAIGPGLNLKQGVSNLHVVTLMSFRLREVFEVFKTQITFCPF